MAKLKKFSFTYLIQKKNYNRQNYTLEHHRVSNKHKKLSYTQKNNSHRYKSITKAIIRVSAGRAANCIKCKRSVVHLTLICITKRERLIPHTMNIIPNRPFFGDFTV